MAVKAAVDEVLGRVAPALERAKAKVGGLYAPRANESAEERRNRIDGLLDTLVGATAGDPDALDVAVSTARNILQGGEVPQNSVGKLREARNTIARSMINLDFCEERKVLAGGKQRRGHVQDRLQDHRRVAPSRSGRAAPLPVPRGREKIVDLERAPSGILPRIERRAGVQPARGAA